MIDVKISRRGILAGLGSVGLAREQQKPVERWGIFEASFPGSPDANLSAVFRIGNREITVRGFYDGAGTQRIRFMPDTTGEWTFVTNRGARGGFTCAAASIDNHGPVI